ncbi:MAG TPA: hypothetical protein VGP13_04070 [Candidatus Paceibacterota bacterium]|jgi:hypothetical protein|nr:hypothetical protein [Candidatus Paceibacterota bacterium]
MREHKDISGNRGEGLKILVSSGLAKLPPEGMNYQKHPFGLSVPHGCETGYFVTQGGGCDENVKFTVSWMNNFFKGRPSLGPQKLRMITVREVEDHCERRFFFEVCVPGISIMGGGGTYYSDHGNSMTRQMRSVLLVLASIYNLDVEDETIFADDVAKMDPEFVKGVDALSSFVEPGRAASRTWSEHFKHTS